MTKMKAFWLLAIGAVLAVFIIQNWQHPSPPVQFLGYQFLPLPQSVIILGFFLLGFLAGWVANIFRARKHQQDNPPEQHRES
jgi:uncharacterized integral membrane protein